MPSRSPTSLGFILLLALCGTSVLLGRVCATDKLSSPGSGSAPSWKRSHLAVAARAGDLAKVQSLMLLGHKVNEAGDGRLPLMEAATQGHVSIAHHLLQNGADVHLTAPDGSTALHFIASFSRNV